MTVENIISLVKKIIDFLLVWLVLYYILTQIKNPF